jgi:hypothetical protein
LAREVQLLISEYHRRNPGLTQTEVDAALRAARPKGSVATQGALAVGLGATLAGGLVAFYFARGSDGAPIWSPIAIVAGLLVVLLLVKGLRRQG